MQVYTHYKIPVLKPTDVIILQNYELNQLVIVDSGSYDYYVVANNSVATSNVDDAISKGYLVPFGGSNVRENQIIMYSHTDNISPQKLLWLRQLIFPNKNLVKVYINDTLFDDWEFGKQYINPAGYTQHLSFPNGNPAGTIKIVYKEPIKFGGMYNIRLDRYEGTTRVKARNAMIPITMWDNTKQYMYLEDAVMNNDDPTDWTVTYKQFDGNETMQLNKKFFNTISIGGFVFNQTFPENLILEMWGYDKVTNFNNSGNTGNMSRSRRSTYYPLNKFTNNKITLDFSGSNPQWGRVNQLKFRFRQETSDGKVYFSEFFKETVSIRHFPLFTTDPTLSKKTYKGIYISTRVV